MAFVYLQKHNSTIIIIISSFLLQTRDLIDASSHITQEETSLETVARMEEVLFLVPAGTNKQSQILY